MYNKEQKILRFSMILLFLALMIVYIIWYQIKGDQLKRQFYTDSESEISSGVQIITISGSVTSEETLSKNEDNKGIVFTGENTVDVVNITGTTDPMVKNTAIKMLSGTSIFYGKIDIIEKLGIKYQYALTDSTGVWYMYLGTPSYDFASIARALKGTLYTMATEQEIIENKLFGNKVVYINLPEYKDKQVIMLVYMNDGIRLIQIEYGKYHKLKSYIKSLFIN